MFLEQRPGQLKRADISNNLIPRIYHFQKIVAGQNASAITMYNVKLQIKMAERDLLVRALINKLD